MSDALQILLPILVTIGLLLLGLTVGRARERAHFREIEERERRYAGFPVTDLRTPIGIDSISGSTLVMGQVVIASDYLKTFFAQIRMLFGGEMRSYATMIDRARREARLRMVEDARSKGAIAVINVRFETSPIGSSVSQQAQPMSEVLCYGTAILPARR